MSRDQNLMQKTFEITKDSDNKLYAKFHGEWTNVTPSNKNMHNN